MAQSTQHELHDDYEAVPSASDVPRRAPRATEPGDILDFCSCGKRKNCPKFERSPDGGMVITDTDFPGVVIRLSPEEAGELAAWASWRFPVRS